MPYATKNKAVQKAIDKGQIEWHMWANTLAVFGSSGKRTLITNFLPA